MQPSGKPDFQFRTQDSINEEYFNGDLDSTEEVDKVTFGELTVFGEMKFSLNSQFSAK